MRALATSLAAALAALPAVARAHAVTVDGDASEWLTRSAPAANVGVVARTAAGAGELVWIDAAGDARTDLSSPEVVADLRAVQITGDATSLYVLVRRQPGAALSGAPIQVQVAIDLDGVAGSGQTWFHGNAKTQVASANAWERLATTLFGSGGAGQVLDPSFHKVADVAAVQGASGDVELGIPWSALGLDAPPAGPVRLTIAAFRAAADDGTIDVGGVGVSNALDVVSDAGAPASSAYPSTWSEVSDGIVDYALEVHFTSTGEVYAPVVVDRVLPGLGVSIPVWVGVRNVSPATVALDRYRIGDEETPGGAEGMYTFPPGATLAPGARYVVAQDGARFESFYGRPPDGELAGSGPGVPGLAAFTAWTGGAAGSFALASAGDEVVLLGPGNTVLDVVAWATGAFPGVIPFTPAPGFGEVLARVAGDTDDCAVDFRKGPTCTSDAHCLSCGTCVAGACNPRAAGTSCSDGDACNGVELCDGAGTCQSGTPLDCSDGNSCTTDACDSVTGCTHGPVNDGTPCITASACDVAEHCQGGVCVGAPLDCDDRNPCTADACDAVAGCAHVPVRDGTPCDDGTVCNGAEACRGGSCAPGTPLDCDDRNPCTADACDAVTGCAHVPVRDGTPCDDGTVCNGAEACRGGSCAPGVPLDCDDRNPCTADSCDAVTGCAHAAVRDGTGCTGDCGAGTCASGACSCASPSPSPASAQSKSGGCGSAGDAGLLGLAWAAGALVRRRRPAAPGRGARR